MTLGPQLSKEVREDLRREILDGGNVAARHQFAATMEALLSNIASWIAIDSWLGGGQVADINETTHVGAAFDEFRAVAAVTCMCAELADAAVTMSAKGRSYAVAAVLRQLIECEYLLAHFAIDLEQARNWWISTPAQIRKEFETKTMRKAGDFSDTEYWMHCDAGGHPNPKGAFYVEWLDPGRRTWPVAREELSIDLGLHLHRTWNAIDRLLAKHHARYKEVRAAEREKAERAWTEWRASDPVAEGLTALGQATVQLPLDS